MLRVTAGHDVNYLPRASRYYLPGQQGIARMWGKPLGLPAWRGRWTRDVYRNLFGKLIAPTGERLYTGRPPRHVAGTWTGKDKDEEVDAAGRVNGTVGGMRYLADAALVSGAGEDRAGHRHAPCRARRALRIAMATLRHSRISLTMEIYTQVPGKVTRDALKRLSDWLDHDEDHGDDARS